MALYAQIMLEFSYFIISSLFLHERSPSELLRISLVWPADAFIFYLWRSEALQAGVVDSYLRASHSSAAVLSALGACLRCKRSSLLWATT